MRASLSPSSLAPGCCARNEHVPRPVRRPHTHRAQNPELFTLTYGAIVRQLLNDFEDNVDEVNTQLDKMCVGPLLSFPALIWLI